MSTPFLSGDLRDHPLPRLLFRIHRTKITGKLIVGSGAKERCVYFRDGRIVAAVSPASVEACARMLLDQGIVGQDHYAQSMLLAQETGQPQTAILEELAAVTETQVLQARRRVSYETLIRLFRLNRGEFAVHRTEHEYGRSTAAAEQLGVEPRQMIYEGIRSTYDVKRLREEMANVIDQATFRYEPEDLSSLEEYEFDEEALLVVDKLREDYCALDALVAATGDETVTRRVLYTLLVTDVLDVSVDVMTAEAVPLPVAEPVPKSAPVRVGAGSYTLSGGSVPSVGRRERVAPRATSRPAQTRRVPTPVEVTVGRLRDKITTTAKFLDQLNYFELLSLPSGATREQVETAYASQQETFDPRRLHVLGLDALQPTVERILVRLERAHGILANAELRAAYVRSLTEEGGQPGSRVGRVRKKSPESNPTT